MERIAIHLFKFYLFSEIENWVWKFSLWHKILHSLWQKKERTNSCIFHVWTEWAQSFWNSGKSEILTSMKFAHSACSHAYQTSNCQNKIPAKWLNLWIDQPAQNQYFITTAKETLKLFQNCILQSSLQCRGKKQ